MVTRRTLAAVGTVAGLGAARAWRRRLVADLPDDRILAADEVRDLYDRIAGGYDAALWAYELVGARRLARRGLDLLGLRPGDTVVDLGCGTGVNLPALADAVAPGGRVVGVDLAPRMLARARRRMAGRDDVALELVPGDVRQVTFPEDTRGVVSTFALEMVPEYDDVVRRACRALAPTRGRITVVGLQRPPRWPPWAVQLAIWCNAPFGVTPAYERQSPWEAVRRHAQEVHHETAVLGATYLSVGQTG